MKLKALALEMLCVEARYEKMLKRKKRKSFNNDDAIFDQFDLFLSEFKQSENEQPFIEEDNHFLTVKFYEKICTR